MDDELLFPEYYSVVNLHIGPFSSRISGRSEVARLTHINWSKNGWPVPQPAPVTDRQWFFYRDGQYGPVSEQEVRNFGERLAIFSDGKGAASVLLGQMWEEIDRLRAEVIRLHNS